uniref:(northern house mosquito) hypothetical protein n=1 Tax=Culex pipiens TaxID=7175 RepID=A0A8D8F0Z4_CULPI
MLLKYSLEMHQIVQLLNPAILRPQINLLEALRPLEVNRLRAGGHHHRVHGVVPQVIVRHRCKTRHRFPQMLLEDPIHRDTIVKVQRRVHSAAVQLFHRFVHLVLVNQQLVDRSHATLDKVAAVDGTNLGKGLLLVHVVRVDVDRKQIYPSDVEPGNGSIGKRTDDQIATFGSGQALDVVRSVQEVAIVAPILVLEQHQPLVDRNDQPAVLEDSRDAGMLFNLFFAGDPEQSVGAKGAGQRFILNRH